MPRRRRIIPDMILQSGALQDPTAFEATCMYTLINHALNQIYEFKRLMTLTIPFDTGTKKDGTTPKTIER